MINLDSLLVILRSKLNTDRIVIFCSIDWLMTNNGTIVSLAVILQIYLTADILISQNRVFQSAIKSFFIHPPLGIRPDSLVLLISKLYRII